MKRKILSLALAFVLTLAFASSALAATQIGVYNATSIYKAYSFGSYSKPSGVNHLEVTCTGLIYHTAAPKNYHVARPMSASGTLYSSSKNVYLGGGATPFTLNNGGTSASTINLKVYNAYYAENGNQSVKMEVHGKIEY